MRQENVKTKAGVRKAAGGTRRSAAAKDQPPAARHNSRERIIDAAMRLSKELGSAHLSLDAVAECAGVSKGGLLYHFPHKAELMRAMVEAHVAEFDRILDEAETTQAHLPHPIVSAYLGAFRHEAAPSGLLAAIAENPDFLIPLRQQTREIFARIRRTSADPELGIIAFLAVTGLKSMSLFETNPMNKAECEAILKRLARMIGG